MQEKLQTMLDTQLDSSLLVKKKRTKYLTSNGPWLIMCMPAILLTFIFSYIPMPGIIIAFKDYNFVQGIFKSQWVGLRNFMFFFVSQDFLVVTRNTVGFNLLFLITGNIIALLFAIMMYEITKKHLLKAYQTIMFFPYFLSWVVAGYMLYSFLNSDLGIINRFLTSIGAQPVEWYAEPKYWPFILLLASIWKGTGSGCVIFYASIIGIDREYYEAAALDGANKRQMTMHITIPFVMPMVILFLILGIGGIFRADFGMFYLLPKNIGILKSTTDVIDTYVYNMLKQVNDVGMSTAVGLYQSVVGFILIMFTNWAVKRYDPESSLF